MSNDIKFSEATPEQFREFFEGKGWSLSQSGNIASKLRNSGDSLFLYSFDARLGIGFRTVLQWCGTTNYPTFQEAIEAADELASTRVFGGWTE